MRSAIVRGQIGSYLLAYLLWFAVCALGVVALLLMRDAVLHFVVIAGLSPWTFGFIDKLTLIVLGLGWLVLVLWCETYFRRAIKRGGLLRRAGVIAAIEATIALASYLFTFLPP